MRELTYGQAVIEAMDTEMARDDRVFLIGEDVGPYGGNFATAKGLWDKYGDWRVKDTPISEAGIIGCALGAAITGLRPIAELMFADFVMVAMDQIANQVAKLRYMSGGQIEVPLVIRAPIGGGRSSAAQHSQNLQALIMHVPGIKIAMPATPYEVLGLFKTAVRDNNPVMFFEHKMEYNKTYTIPDDEEIIIPFGEAAVKKEGTDVTVVGTSSMANLALKAVEALNEENIDIEVIDPRTIVPLDLDTIVESVQKTGRLVVVDEGHYYCGVASEIAQRVIENAFDYLDAPIQRVCTEQVPIPFSPPLESRVVPSEEKIIEAVKKTLR